jgi:hypothetical protein
MNSVLRRHRLLIAAGAAGPLALLLSGCAGTADAAVVEQGTQGAPAAQQTSDCRTNRLAVTVREGDHGMQKTRYLLLFRNTSDRTCTLYGYPGVSFVRGDRGLQTGSPAWRTGDAKSLVTLKPGGVAHAVLTTVRPEMAKGCHAVAVRGFRVYPPNETAAAFVPAPQQACSTSGKSVPSIAPVRAGATES